GAGPGKRQEPPGAKDRSQDGAEDSRVGGAAPEDRRDGSAQLGETAERRAGARVNGSALRFAHRPNELTGGVRGDSVLSRLKPFNPETCAPKASAASVESLLLALRASTPCVPRH